MEALELFFMPNPALETEFSRLIALIRGCAMCRIPPPAYPIVSGNLGARVMSVGQCPGALECELGRPFAGQAGRTLFAWLASVGIDERRFRAGTYMTAITKCYPAPDAKGRRETPLPREVINCAPYLVRELRIVQPEVILAIGGMAIRRLLGEVRLENVVGRAFTRRCHGFDALVIPLPHPSGRSAWRHAPENRRLLGSALKKAAEACAPLL